MWIRSVSAALLLTTLHSSTFAVKFTTVMSIKSSVCCSTPSFFSLGDVLLVKSPLSVSISPILVEICRRGHHFHWSTPTWKIEQLENRIVSFPPPPKKKHPEIPRIQSVISALRVIFQDLSSFNLSPGPSPIGHRPSHHVTTSTPRHSAPPLRVSSRQRHGPAADGRPRRRPDERLPITAWCPGATKEERCKPEVL